MTDEEFTKKHDEILNAIPNEIWPALSYMAWDRGHSAGLEEVLWNLSDLVDNLRGAIESYGSRKYNDGHLEASLAQ